jgi:hypothetical protein
MVLYRCSEGAAVGAGAGAEERLLPVQREQPDPTRQGSTTAGRQSGTRPTGNSLMREECVESQTSRQLCIW